MYIDFLIQRSPVLEALSVLITGMVWVDVTPVRLAQVALERVAFLLVGLASIVWNRIEKPTALCRMPIQQLRLLTVHMPVTTTMIMRIIIWYPLVCNE